MLASGFDEELLQYGNNDIGAIGNNNNCLPRDEVCEIMSWYHDDDGDVTDVSSVKNGVINISLYKMSTRMLL